MPPGLGYKKQAFKKALDAMGKPGRRVGRNPTPGVPRRVGRMDMGPGNPALGRPDRFHHASSNNKGPLQNSKPPYIRDPLNDYQGHNLPIAPGEHPPGAPLPPGSNFPPGGPKPRPAGTLGMRRLSMLGDKNKRNDKEGLAVLMRLFGRAQGGKNFGGKAFGEHKGSNLDDFFASTDQYTKGTGYRRMLRQAAGLPVRPRTKNYPGKPATPPGPYIK